LARENFICSQITDYYSLLSERVINRETLLESVPRPVLHLHGSREARSMLTRTEQQIVVGLFLGLSAKEIANVRETSNRTVEGHITAIKRKLGVKKLSGYILSSIFEECLTEGFG
jgi:DNA-binding NarL/FixJ family response regulator